MKSRDVLGVFLWAPSKSAGQLRAMYPSLSMAELRDALDFYAERRDEIDRLIHRMGELLVEFRRRCPTGTLADPDHQAFMKAVLDRLRLEGSGP